MQYSDVFKPASRASGTRVAHDAKIRVTIKFPDKKREVEILTPEQLEGRLLTLGCLYNVSGYYNPYQPTVKFKILSGYLKDGELCSCTRCTNAA